jgi:hypothetical protein
MVVGLRWGMVGLGIIHLDSQLLAITIVANAPSPLSAPALHTTIPLVLMFIFYCMLVPPGR